MRTEDGRSARTNPLRLCENVTNEPNEVGENVANDPAGDSLSLVPSPLPGVTWGLEAVDEPNAPNEPTRERRRNEDGGWKETPDEPTASLEDATSEPTGASGERRLERMALMNEFDPARWRLARPSSKVEGVGMPRLEPALAIQCRLGFEFLFPPSSFLRPPSSFPKEGSDL